MVKINLFQDHFLFRDLTKLLRMIKVTSLFLLICLGASARSQSISLNMKQSSLVQVFEQVQKITGKSFVYKWETLNGTRPVDIKVANASLKEVLDICIKDQPLSYTIVDDVVVISKKTQEAPATIPPPLREIKGKITDEQGRPVAGATVLIKGTKKFAVTNEEGEFSIEAEENVVLVVSHVSFEQTEIRVRQENTVSIKLQKHVSEEKGVAVNTGYARISKERFVGSVSQLDSAAFERRAGMGIFDRLDGTVTGVLFDKKSANGAVSIAGLTIRGLSTLNSYRAPMIVLDDFPVIGNALNDINPNDVESITVLKDAAAMSIWGARAGNGVIIITTKKGKYNQPLRVSVSSDITVHGKPNLFYYDQMSISDYVDLETYFFNRGYYDGLLSSSTWPVVTPVVEMLAQRRAGLISAQDSATQINAFKEHDLRYDLDKYVYRNKQLQRYYLNMAGGTHDVSYFFSSGYNVSFNELQNNKPSKQVNLNSGISVRPFKKLQVQSNILYTREQGKAGGFQLPTSIYPYMQLADAEGRPLAVPFDRRLAYLDTLGGGTLLDSRYRPLEEMNLADGNRIDQLLQLTFKLNYKPATWLTVEASYQYALRTSEFNKYHGVETYYTREQINRFTNLAATSPSLRYPIPIGTIYEQERGKAYAQNARVRADLNKTFSGIHQLSAMVAADLIGHENEFDAVTFYGFNKENGSYYRNMDFLTFYPTIFGVNSQIPSGLNYQPQKTLRQLSLSSYASYAYKGRYMLYGSARKDGSNIFGANTNRKWKPLWSAGLSWELSKEAFYKLSWMPYIRLRGSYGSAGNPGTTPAVPIIQYQSTPATITNLPRAVIETPPNPNLKWENVAIINMAADFRLFDDRLSGSIDVWRKKSTDLISTIPLAPATGVRVFTTNSAGLAGRGMDISITSKNTTGKLLWETNFGFSRAKTFVTSLNILNPNYRTRDFSRYSLNAAVGQLVYSLASYRWAGLDPATGDPRGYYNKQVSTDYLAINGDSVQNQVIHGSSIPLTFGFVGNSFSWKNFTLSMNLAYRLNFYFRKPTVDYGQFGNTGILHADYAKRWQKPGDENFTNVPSFVYPSNNLRDVFYQLSEITALRGDHIRLQDIRLQYNLNMKTGKNLPARNVILFFYANNLNIILWRKNKFNLDPDFVGGRDTYAAPTPKAWSAGIKLNL